MLRINNEHSIPSRDVDALFRFASSTKAYHLNDLCYGLLYMFTIDEICGVFTDVIFGTR